MSLPPEGQTTPPSTDMDTSTNSTDSPAEPKKEWTRSADYYFFDGSIVIRVEKVLYKIQKGFLVRVSDVMQQLLSIPDGKPEGETREGTDDYPFFIDGITSQEFDDFLGGFAYRLAIPSNWNEVAADDKERVYTNLLKLSDMWEIEAGKACAIKNLEDIYLPPSRRLQLACRYKIPQWIEPAVRWILNHPLKELTLDDLTRMGLEVFGILVKGKEHMDVEIRRTANVAPRMIEDPSWECDQHKSCAKVWKRLWRKEIGWLMLHPTIPMKPSEVLWTVKKFSHPGLSPRCLEDMCRVIRDDILFFDERVVPATADTIKYAYHMA
ncbi:hypothetical protein DFH06DRAFT_1146559 [Mycena polygramma]|nr:hypothetical protein DFH06DRAFT_1146559 [Mycena polygramma]